MRIWEHTFAELTGGLTPHPDAGIPHVPQPFFRKTVIPIPKKPGYATAVLSGSPDARNQVLLRWDGSDWKCVGSYVDDTITVEQNEQCKGLGTELFLRCLEHRTIPLTTNFTQSGFDLVKRAHKKSVTGAVAAGLPVPQKVKDEYGL
jgi:hypothetical protein